MPTPTTLVVGFGAAVATGEGLIRLELDDELNIIPGGDETGADQIKTVFSPGDEVFFLIHHDSKIQIVSVKATAGTVTILDSVRRERTADLLFTEENPVAELEYIPANEMTVEWWGHTAKLTQDKRTLTASVDNGQGAFPAYGRVSYDAEFLSCKLIAPMVELGYDEEFPVQIVVRYQPK